MESLDVETRIAEGEQALQALLKCARANAGKLEAHAAEQGLFTRLMPIGLAAMTRYFAQRGTGAVGPAVTRADGVLLARAQKLRVRDYCSLVGKFAVTRTCDRTPGPPGSLPLDAQLNLPERCDADCLPEWMTVFAVEHPCKERSSWCEPLCALEVAESVLMAVAKEAPANYEACYAQPPLPPEDTAGALRVVSFAGQGVPLITAEATQLNAKLGTGETRQKQQAALVGVSETVDPKPRSPEVLAELLVEPEAARARRHRAGVTDAAPRAQQVHRLASLVRTKQVLMALITADAERSDPQHRTPWVVVLDGALGLWRLATQFFKSWKRVTCVLDIMPGIGDLWSAPHAWFGAGAQDGTRWVQAKLAAILRGRVG
jgi:hypothetical protein